jgi:adenylosuccinate lyase
MRNNLEMTRGTVFSGHLLLALVDKGMTREDAYAVVQKHALAAFDGGATLLERASGDKAISAVLAQNEVTAIFDLNRYLKEVDRIITRALAPEN